MSQSKEPWCLDCTPGVLTAKQQCVTTVRCTFTFLFYWCFLSVWPCHPSSVSISQSDLSSLSLTICFFLYLLVSLCVFLFTHLRFSGTPVDSCNSSGRAIRPISPISWWWVGMMRNGLVAKGAAYTAVRYVCVCVCVCAWAAMNVMSVWFNGSVWRVCGREGQRVRRKKMMGG